jgi:exodeoxyribonuclease VII small subunit
MSDEPSYETLYARLQEVVARLERGDLALAESLAAYEEGVRLATACQRLLDAAELRVRQLQVGAEGPELADWSE